MCIHSSVWMSMTATVYTFTQWILYVIALSADIIFCAAGVPRTPPHQYCILDLMFMNIFELIITAIDTLWKSTNTYICYVGVNSCDSRRTKIHSMNEGWQFVINAYTVRWLLPFISTLLNSAYKIIHSSLCGTHLRLFTERLRSRFIICWASLCCRSVIFWHVINHTKCSVTLFKKH